MSRPSSRQQSETLRHYYSRKAEQRQQEEEQLAAAAEEQQAATGQPRRQASVSQLMARLSPSKRAAAAAAAADKDAKPARVSGKAAGPAVAAAQQRPQAQPAGAKGGPRRSTAYVPPAAAPAEPEPDGIPAFRPPSPPPEARLLTPPGCSSPGKAQLEAVRALRQAAPAAPPASKPRCPQQQQRQQRQYAVEQQQTPQGTPGLSQGSVGRAINAHIASSIENLFGTTPPEVSSSWQQRADAAAAGAEAEECEEARAGEVYEAAMHAEAAWGDGGGMAAYAGAPQLASAAAAGFHARHQQQQQSQGLPEQQPEPLLSASPDGFDMGAMPEPPPPPPQLNTAMTSSGRFEPQGSPQAFLSPVFMSRKQRSIYCEIDEPGSSIAFQPRERRRTGRLHRLAASLFGCFVPPPERRSPAPSFRTRLPSSQGGSPTPRPRLAMGGLEPLRASLAELALNDPALREQLRTSLAAELSAAAAGRPQSAGPAGPLQQGQPGSDPQYGDMLGLRDEDAQLNMASPVLPTRPTSACDSPDSSHRDDHLAQGYAEAARENSLAKRNLMDVLRSREAGGVRQQQQRQQRPGSGASGRAGVQYVHPQQSLQHAARQQQQPPAGQSQQQLHLQPWQRQGQRRQAPQDGRAKAAHSRVSVAELIAAPAAGSRPASAGAAGQSGGRSGHAARAPMSRHNSGSKRGREVLGASRAPSDDAPAFTPKRRDLSKPSWRSEALHQALSPSHLPAAAGRQGSSVHAQQAVPAVPAVQQQVPQVQPAASRQQVLPATSAGAAAAAAATVAVPADAPVLAAAAAAAAERRVPAVRGYASVPASPMQGHYANSQRHGSSAPSSPLVAAGPRLNRAATIRAAATQRKLQERQAEEQAVMAKSPDRWLRAAAAEGLSLRQAAVLASPGKSARPHYHPQTARQQQQQQVAPGPGGAARAAGRAATPGAGRFDSFAAGEAGAEPYSARLHTVERQHLAAALRPAAVPGAAAVEVAVSEAERYEEAALEPSPQARGGSLDFANLAADREAYLQMLQMLAQGLAVAEDGPRQQLEAAKRPVPPPGLSADLLASAAAAARAEQERGGGRGKAADGADTVRPRSLAASQEALLTSRTADSTIEYCLEGPEAQDEQQAARHEPPAAPAGPRRGRRAAPQAALTPAHHNALFDQTSTPSKSSPVAQQRMLTMTAAAVKAQARQERHGQRQGRQEQQQRRANTGSSGGGGAASSSAAAAASSSANPSRSISFGSAGCKGAASSEQQQPQERTDESGGPGGVVRQGGKAAGQASVSKPARKPAAAVPPGLERHPRLAALAALLESAQAEGRHFTLPQLQAAGYSTHDLAALKRALEQRR